MKQVGGGGWVIRAITMGLAWSGQGRWPQGALGREAALAEPAGELPDGIHTEHLFLDSIILFFLITI